MRHILCRLFGHHIQLWLYLSIYSQGHCGYGSWDTVIYMTKIPFAVMRDKFAQNEYNNLGNVIKPFISQLINHGPLASLSVVRDKTSPLTKICNQ